MNMMQAFQHMEPYVEELIRNAGGVDIESPTLTTGDRVQFAKKQVVSTFKKVFLYILIGVSVGVDTVTQNLVLKSWIEAVLGGNNPFRVILAALPGLGINPYPRQNRARKAAYSKALFCKSSKLVVNSV